jgi:hypothetical protein
LLFVLTYGFIWVGHIPAVDHSTVTLAVADAVMAGSVVTPESFYAIRYRGGAVHEVSQIDQSKFPPESPPISVSPAQRAGGSDAAEPTAPADDGSTIDVMVLYTAAAMGDGGPAGMTTLINLGISETNTSYLNSGIVHRLRLVHTQQATYTENDDLRKDLDALSNGGGGTAI